MQFKRVLPISNELGAKKRSYQDRIPAAIQIQYIQEFEASGLTQVQFCREHNIPYMKFSNWFRSHRSENGMDKKPVTNTRGKDGTPTLELATNISCSLPCGLSIAISPIALADLPNIIEILSQCKLN